MTRRTQYQGSASSRRREARAHLQSEASKSSEALHRPTPSRAIMSLKRKQDYTPKSLMDVSVCADHKVIEYKNQIIRATYLYMHEFNRKPIVEGSTCLQDVGIFFAGHRKSNQVTAR